MVEKLAVVAIGGNSLIRDPGKPDIESQWGAVHETCGHIAAMIAAGWSVTITHGNGPQVGANMRRFEIAQKFGLYEIPARPDCGAYPGQHRLHAAAGAGQRPAPPGDQPHCRHCGDPDPGGRR